VSKRANLTMPLDRQLELCGWPKPDAEVRFDRIRRWRFDWAYPQYRIAIEREGGVWIKGRHTRPSGYLKDVEKYNEAALRGWRILRYTPAMERSGEALKLVERALKEAKYS
jgi:hypothetical protein